MKNKVYQQELKKTQEKLASYGCSFKEYMKDCGRRTDIDLEDLVETCLGQGVVVGWNGSCNYRVFLLETKEISIFHPEEVIKIK